MANRYDQRTTQFSPEGRLLQVEYAMESINNAGTVVGVLSPLEGVVLAAERKVVSKLLEPSKVSEKMFVLDEHIICAVGGLFADANYLIEFARRVSQSYSLTYQEPMPVESLIQRICDRKQGQTQFGGQRPFGVSFVYAGYDKHFGYQLYTSDPSGNYSGWKATAIGANNQTATSLLKQEYVENCNLNQALALAAKVLCKTMDTTTISPEKLEFEVLVKTSNDAVISRTLSNQEVEIILKENNLLREQS